MIVHMQEKSQEQPEAAISALEQQKQELLTLANELWQSGETFPFSGIDSVTYAKIKIAEEEYPGFTTPIDDIISRLQNEGMKVVLGNDPLGGSIYILPAGSNNIESDSIMPRQLQVSEEMDERLKALILASKR